MKTTIAAVLAALAMLPGVPAGAAPPTALGQPCGYGSLTSPTAAEDVQIGYIDGGPLVVADRTDATGNPVTATLTCTIQVDQPNHTGAGAVSASASGAGAVNLLPTPVSYRVGPGQTVFLCTRLTLTDARGDTYRLYWDSEARAFSSSDTVQCVGPAPEQPPWWWDLVEREVACPSLAALHPGVPDALDVRPDGDVHVAGEFLWDCPPYETA